jgi:hypothetical protein
VLIRHYVVLILGIDRLVMWRNVDIVVREFVFAEVLKEVGIARPIEVDVGVGRVF